MDLVVSFAAAVLLVAVLYLALLCIPERESSPPFSSMGE